MKDGTDPITTLVAKGLSSAGYASLSVLGVYLCIVSGGSQHKLVSAGFRRLLDYLFCRERASLNGHPWFAISYDVPVVACGHAVINMLQGTEPGLPFAPTMPQPTIGQYVGLTLIPPEV